MRTIAKKYKQYDKYKSSGLEWLGDVPECWEIVKIGQVYEERNTKVSDKDYEPLSVTKNGIVPQLENAAKTDNGDNRKLVKQNDFVINSRSDRRGSCGISSYDGSVSLINTVLRPRQNMYNLFYNYIFKSEHFADEFYKWGNGIVDDLWSTKWTSMKNICIPYPDIEEQKSIAKFLSEKIVCLDKITDRKQKLIKLLKEKRQALISDVVTKGLDKNVKLKSSGIEWLGDIPEHWHILPAFVSLKEQKIPNEGMVEKNLLSLSYGNIIRKNIELNFGLLPESFETYQIVHKGNIILRLTDLQNDKRSLRVGLAKETGIITSAYLCLKAFDSIIPEYAYSILHLYDLLKVLYNMGGGVRQSLKYEEFKRLPIIIPPLKEQIAIVKFLDEKTQIIDQTVSKLVQQIEKIKESRQTLISNIVTGKIDVREFVRIEE